MRALFGVLVACIFCYLLAPLLVAVAVSFSPGNVVEFPPSSLSLKWYAQALATPLFRDGLINSVLLGLAAAAISTMLGTAAALALTGADFPGRGALQNLLLSPLMVPGVVLGIALLAAFAQIGLREAWWRLLCGHVLLTLPFCIRMIMVSLLRLDPALVDAAQTLGARRADVFLHVTLPLIRPGIFAGALFAFVVSFDNVPVSVFLVDASTTTLPLAIISYLEYNFDPSVAAVSSLLIIAMLALSIVLERAVSLRRIFST